MNRNRPVPAGAPLECAQAREMASARFDGELGAERELALHLAGCPACREFAGRLEQVRGELRELGAGRMPDLWLPIAARARRWRARRRVAQLAAALIGCAGTLTLLRAATGAPASPSLLAPLAPFAALGAPQDELQRLSESPEQLLLLALAARVEERR